jgi:hypothetical protein
MSEKERMQRLAIVGSRSFDDYALLRSEVGRHCWNYFGTRDEPREIISGGASGADALAERYAKERGWPFRAFPADWKKWGKAAGILRNRDIVRAADMVIAFWDGISRGTAHTIETAKREAVPCHVIRFSPGGGIGEQARLARESSDTPKRNAE